jgi:hypothetical protein
MSKQDVAPPQERWTRVGDYMEALARRRTARRSRRKEEARTEPEAPNVVLSTIPFAALIMVLGLMVVAFAVAAWPPSQRDAEAPKAAASEQGTAAPGWLDEASKEMR